MTNERVLELEKKIENLLPELFMPINEAGEYDQKKFDLLYEILNELKRYFTENKSVSKSLVWQIFLIYFSIDRNVSNIQATDPNFFANPIWILKVTLEGYVIETFSNFN